MKIGSDFRFLSFTFIDEEMVLSKVTNLIVTSIIIKLTFRYHFFLKTPVQYFYICLILFLSVKGIIKNGRAIGLSLFDIH